MRWVFLHEMKVIADVIIENFDTPILLVCFDTVLCFLVAEFLNGEPL